MAKAKSARTGKQKLDLYKLHAADYATPKSPKLVDIGKAQYLAIEGQGQPGGQQFQDDVGALYGMAFTIKMANKFAGLDYAVCKLEGLWWHDNPDEPIAAQGTVPLHWKMLIRTPDFIGKTDLKTAVATLAERGKSPLVGEVRLETLREGRCVQMLQVGPYADEPATIAKMKEFAVANGQMLHGLHHEIYLSDPRRVAAAKLKTILRLPVKTKS
jgi:hypothetical protein